LVLAGQACTTEPHPSYSDCFWVTAFVFLILIA
jgi:hypothetical protein